MAVESKCPVDVAVWGNGSLLTHVILSPMRTVNTSGSKWLPSITTVRVVGFAGAAAAPPSSRPRRTSAAPTETNERSDTGSFTRRSALAERRLDFLGVLQVRD